VQGGILLGSPCTPRLLNRRTQLQDHLPWREAANSSQSLSRDGNDARRDAENDLRNIETRKIGCLVDRELTY
jgi:hypothetical protein